MHSEFIPPIYASHNITNVINQAYNEGKYYPNYAWILINWSDESWKEYLNETNCTESHITTVLDRSLILTPYPNGEVMSY